MYGWGTDIEKVADCSVYKTIAFELNMSSCVTFTVVVLRRRSQGWSHIKKSGKETRRLEDRLLSRGKNGQIILLINNYWMRFL
jgi:hypothetical protein